VVQNSRWVAHRRFAVAHLDAVPPLACHCREKLVLRENLNDLALDCRLKDLQESNSLCSNNDQMHRLKHSYWSGGPEAVFQEAQGLQCSQETYWNTVRDLPPLLDCVFAFKRRRRERLQGPQPQTIVLGSAHDSPIDLTAE
jgi:hypothetical protein